MSDTPRTDAGARDISVKDGVMTVWPRKSAPFVERRISEELERENAVLRSLLREAITGLARYRAALSKEGQP